MKSPSQITVISLCSSCPDALLTSISNAKSFSNAFDTTRPIAFHNDCYVTECRVKQPPESSTAGPPLLVVVKTYLKLKMSDSAIRQALSEVQIHSSLPAHDHIIPLLAALEDSKHLYLVIERAEDGDLRRYFSSLASTPIPRKGSASACGTQSSYCLTTASLGPTNILDYHPSSPTKYGSSGCLNTFTSFSCQGPEGSSLYFHFPRDSENDAKAISDQEARDCNLRDFVIRPLLQALIMLHDQGIVHRDLKPENLLIHKGRVVIADFGLSIQSEPSLSSSDVSSKHPHETDGSRSVSSSFLTSALVNASAAGTPLYAAPEVLRTMFENKPMTLALSHKNDIWALGVLVLEAILGYHPMTRLPHGASPAPTSCSHYCHAYSGGHDNMLYSIAYLKHVPLPESSLLLGEQLRSFLSKALKTNPDERPDAKELLASL